MIRVWNRLNCFSRWAVGLVLGVLGLLVLRASLSSTRSVPATVATVIVAGAVIAALVLLARFLPERLPRWVLPALCVLCLAVKLAWVLTHQIQPASDYATFYQTAVRLSEGWTYQSDYVAVFPHIFGYAFFLSLFFAVFGPSALLASLVNVGLTLASMGMLWYLASRLLDQRAACLACLAWIGMPSQTMFNVFVLSEPYYTALLLGAGCLGVRISRLSGDWRGKLWKGGLLAAAIGLLLALVNAARPIAVIGVIAMVLYLFLLRPWGTRQDMLFRLLLCGCAALCFFLGGRANNALFTARMGVEPPSGVGYSLAVGFNWEGGGVWNQADGAQIGEDMAQARASGSFDPQEIQDLWKERFLQRLQGHSPGDFLQLMDKKLAVLTGSDAAPLLYMKFLPQNNAILWVFSNGAWLGLWLLAIWSAVKLCLRRLSVALTLPAMFLLGLTMAQLLVEVAVRYHYCMVPALILLAAAAPPRKTNGQTA